MNAEPNAKPVSTSKAGLFATLPSSLLAKGSGALSLEAIQTRPHSRLASASLHAGGRDAPRLASISLLGLTLAALLALAGAAIAPSPALASEPCPNEALRRQANSTALPDCRAYELVSPGSNPFLTAEVFEFDPLAQHTIAARASTTGDRFAYYTRYPADNAQSSGFYYLSTRGERGWSIEPVAAQDSPSAKGNISCEQDLQFSPDLSRGVLADGWEAYPPCQSSEEELAPGAPSGYGNLFLRDTATGSYQLVNITPESAVPANALFVAGSADFSHIVFTDAAQLTPEAPPGASLYEWAGGVVHLLTILPDGEPTQGDIAGSDRVLAQVQHAVSADGERVYFASQGSLYLRENSAQPQSAVDGEGHCTEPLKGCTIQIDESHGTGSSGAGEFREASTDGARVFFTDESRLTGDSTAAPGAPDLYEYDVEAAQLTDLTANAAEPAGVSAFLGVGEDGSYLYFLAAANLTGTEVNEHGEEAEPGASNLYVRHAGKTTFVAPGTIYARVSPNGKFLAFSSSNRLTGFNCLESGGSEVQCVEIFRYDAAADRLDCASCDPEGSQPVAPNFLPPPESTTTRSVNPAALYRPRSILDDGRVFFDTTNALLPQDENEGRDVYEYEGAQLHLISTGTSTTESSFYDASPSGKDVFFVTSQDLIRSDTDRNNSLYDAREGGGFLEPPPPPECEGEACRVGGTVAPGTSPTATATFNGAGNPRVVRCKGGLVKRRGRCVKKSRHHAKTHHSHNRVANPNRRTGR